MKFSLVCSGPESGDCTAPYRVAITEEGTLNEFIDEVLDNHKDEWGYIGIRSNQSIFGQPIMEYSHGKSIRREALHEFADRPVKEITASGGWTRMDYIVTL